MGRFERGSTAMRESPMGLEQAVKRLEHFYEGALTSRLASLESAFCASTNSSYAERCVTENLDESLLVALLQVKRVAGQINVGIHAVGILLALPRILTKGERVQILSLGAGNTGRHFDLVTDRRVAEFKFIHWRGTSDTIRQNSIFKDFYYLAESNIRKPKFLYVLGREHPLRFLNGGRALTSVMSRNSKLFRDFRVKYGQRFRVVREYFLHRKRSVQIVDLLESLPMLRDLPPDEISTRTRDSTP